MDYGIGKGIDNLFKITLVLGLFSIFGVWKLIEIIIWLFKHINITL